MRLKHTRAQTLKISTTMSSSAFFFDHTKLGSYWWYKKFTMAKYSWRMFTWIAGKSMHGISSSVPTHLVVWLRQCLWRDGAMIIVLRLKRTSASQCVNNTSYLTDVKNSISRWILSVMYALLLIGRGSVREVVDLRAPGPILYIKTVILSCTSNGKQRPW